MFHTTFDDTAPKIAKTITHGTALRLFILLPQYLSYTEWRDLDQQQIGGVLNTDHSSVSRGLKVLKEAGVVEKQGSGSHIKWRLSPEFGWRGDVASYHKEQRRRGKFAPAAPSDARTIAAESIVSSPDAPPPARTNKRQTALRLLRSLPESGAST